MTYEQTSGAPPRPAADGLSAVADAVTGCGGSPRTARGLPFPTGRGRESRTRRSVSARLPFGRLDPLSKQRVWKEAAATLDYMPTKNVEIRGEVRG